MMLCREESPRARDECSHLIFASIFKQHIAIPRRAILRVL